MEYSENTLATLRELRKNKIHIALDDFGTGYSSMNYLKRLPIDSIKVDQSFVSGLLDDKDSLAIVRSIVTLSKNLGFHITAEGIETLNQAEILKFLGCETLQGFYFSKPLHKNDMLQLSNKSWDIDAVNPLGYHYESRRY
ncbi:MAG TPA: EAL domain-containing protein, partial [Nitrosomonas sp.]|nr:EAL domain-containing protein [Nitrosomonas sp.]HNA71358.1 EAL domain-containing protein [Nitrosomonas sp.]